ncbi:MAG: U32 family peptidase [Lachnospiraceae bacterium]|nr:U32 family peptidase [Ruminococcus sp.]MCM1275142.1 U32 family peptidase [Lachnospiraceae bacterium]
MSEILAPCGGYESLAAALNAGADAVYVGMKRFSARGNAENFSDEELKTAVCECHRRGVKLYVTLNTLVYDSELPELCECIKTAAECGVDGLILQDLGAAALAERICPELPRHASTQMTLNSVSGVRAAERLGFSRVVLGRELSKEEIAGIAENTDAELEIFVHGALCVSVSGQCYMSSVFGCRSGNRGLCAQPCRLDFSVDGQHNVLSLKDGSIVGHLRELPFISSFKIEGRMKRPEYVACAADACRKALDGVEYDAERLADIFSRGGLTESYFDGTMSGMQGVRGREDVENSANALKGIKELYKAEYPRTKLSIHLTVKRGEPITFGGSYAAEDGASTLFGRSEIVPEEAKGAPLTSEAVCERMSKLGGTQFYAGEMTAEVEDGLFVSAAALNGLRRDIVEACEKFLLQRLTHDYKPSERNLSDFLPRKAAPRAESGVRYRAEVHTAEQLKQALELDFDLIYAPMGLLDESTPDKRKIAVIPPLILSDCEEETEARLRELREMGFNKGLAHTLGHAELLKKCEYNILGGYRMNVLNSLAARACSDFGFWDITLSFEGTAAALAEINSPRPTGIVGYGRLPLMLTRRCPIADGKPCGRKTPFGEGESCRKRITDRQGNELPVLCGGNCTEILNPDVLILSDKRSVLEKFDFVVLKFTVEDDIKPVYDMYKRGGKPEGKLTRGLYFRGAE